MKISDKIKFDPNIMPFALFFPKTVSIPSDINSGPKISLPGPALSLPGPALSLPGLALLLLDPHYFTVNFSSRKIKQMEEMSLIGTITKMPFYI